MSPTLTLPLHHFRKHRTASKPDTMYLHEAMREPDRAEFLKAMRKEKTIRWEMETIPKVPRSCVPKDHNILPTTWQMKCKHNIKPRQVKKWKLQLNINGSSMKQGVYYDQMYAPMASWSSVHFLLTMPPRHATQIDYNHACQLTRLTGSKTDSVLNEIDSIQNGLSPQTTQQCGRSKRPGEYGINTLLIILSTQSTSNNQKSTRFRKNRSN